MSQSAIPDHRWIDGFACGVRAAVAEVEPGELELAQAGFEDVADQLVARIVNHAIANRPELFR